MTNAEMDEYTKAGSAQDQLQREKLKVERPLGKFLVHIDTKREKRTEE